LRLEDIRQRQPGQPGDTRFQNIAAGLEDEPLAGRAVKIFKGMPGMLELGTLWNRHKFIRCAAAGALILESPKISARIDAIKGGIGMRGRGSRGDGEFQQCRRSKSEAEN
jgi:hypothetical protein